MRLLIQHSQYRKSNALRDLLAAADPTGYETNFSDISNISFTEQQQTGSGISDSGDITYGRAAAGSRA